jgi:hypothetical protein
MNRVRKTLAGLLISVFGIAVFLLFASASNAVTFPVFDHMDSYAQAEFIADMVDRTEKALRDDGKPDLSLKMEQLFALVEPGDKISLGLVELERNVARARVADLDRLRKDPKAQRVEVEDALFVTLKKNGIEMSDNAMNSVLNAMASFHEMTNAEFRAQTPSEQRHIVRLLSDLAFPDYNFRDMVRTQKGSFLGLDDTGIRNLAEIMSTQFPTSGEQPGFRNVQAAVETENSKAPNHAVFPTLLIYVLDELEKGVDARNQDLVDRSVLLPDGRHAYIGDDGAFWIFPSDEGKEGAKYKLEANLQPLAKRLAECMETGGITDGRRAQIVCLERVAGVRPPSTTPAAPLPSVARVPQRPRLAPIMVGRVDVSHLAGLQRGDTREYISSIFGSPASGSDGDVYSRGDGVSIKANSGANGPLEVVTATGKSSRGVADPLLDLLGKNESAAIALLGPPKARESLWDIDNTDLIWTFPMDGKPSPQYANPGSIQTLTLHYRTGVGCESINVVW